MTADAISLCRSGPDAGHNDSCQIHLGGEKLWNLKLQTVDVRDPECLRPSVADANSIIKALQPSLYARGSKEAKPYSNGDNIDHRKYYLLRGHILLL